LRWRRRFAPSLFFSTSVRDAPVIVCAAHVALLDLRRDLFPPPTVANEARYVAELLLAHVIKVEDDGVALTAVDTWMCHEIFTQTSAIRGNDLDLIAAYPAHLSRVKAPVSLGVIAGEACPTPRLQKDAAPHARRELGLILHLAAPSAAVQLR
jgi:hypothetical protein